MHELAPRGRRPARPGGAAGLLLLAAGRHAADDEREVRRRGEVAADRAAQRRAGLQPLRHRRQADRPRRDRRARARATEPSVLLVDGDGAAAGARRRPVGAAGRRGRAAPARAARQGLAGRLDRPRRRAAWSATRRSPTTAATPAAAASAPCSGRSCSRRWRCGAATKVAPGRPAGGPRRRARPARALVRPGDRQVPRARHARQPARLQRHRDAADAQLPGRDVRRARRGSPPRTSPRRASVARDSCASCSIGCEHIYERRRRQAGARRVRERLRARAAVRRVRPRRRARGQRAAATSSGSTRSRPAGRSPGRWSAPSAA